jgi:hypothetical protein
MGEIEIAIFSLPQSDDDLEREVPNHHSNFRSHDLPVRVLIDTTGNVAECSGERVNVSL